MFSSIAMGGWFEIQTKDEQPQQIPETDRIRIQFVVAERSQKRTPRRRQLLF